MKEIDGVGAVVTGAASGIGLGVSRKLAEAGARVVMADVEAPRLEKVAIELAAEGLDVVPRVTDVSKAADVEALAAFAQERLGAVRILCNNAGVATGGRAIWEATEADWSWVLGVNLMGVVHGLRAFVPRMIEHGQPGHIVNTSSILGLASGGGSIYSVSKHAVTRLSEGLYSDLRARSLPIGVTVLCPGLVATRIVTSGRNRPADLASPLSPDLQAGIAQRREMAERHFAREGMPVDRVGEMVVEAIRDDRFYVLTHPELIKGVRQRFDAILAGGPPPIQSPEPGREAEGAR